MSDVGAGKGRGMRSAVSASREKQETKMRETSLSIRFGSFVIEAHQGLAVLVAGLIVAVLLW
jgi:hypothetical protein